MRAARQIAIFLIFVVGIILILSLVFGGNKNGGKKSANPDFSVLNYIEKDSKVVAITDGPITGDDTHRTLRISVDRNSRTIDVIQGYQGKVVSTKTYENNQQAYDKFLHALSRANFGKTRKTNLASEEGVCATGRRFIFGVTEGDKSVSRTWTANCVKGNAAAVPARVTALFREQITDYDQVIKGHSF